MSPDKIGKTPIDKKIRQILFLSILISICSAHSLDRNSPSIMKIIQDRMSSFTNINECNEEETCVLIKDCKLPGSPCGKDSESVCCRETDILVSTSDEPSKKTKFITNENKVTLETDEPLASKADAEGAQDGIEPRSANTQETARYGGVSSNEHDTNSNSGTAEALTTNNHVRPSTHSSYLHSSYLNQPYHRVPNYDLPYYDLAHHGLPLDGLPHYGLPYYGLPHYGLRHHGLPQYGYGFPLRYPHIPRAYRSNVEYLPYRPYPNGYRSHGYPRFYYPSVHPYSQNPYNGGHQYGYRQRY